MSEIKTIASRLKEVLLDGKWIANTNFKEQISSVTFSEATYKIGNVNSIAALTFHINYYLNGILNFFETGKLEIKDQYSFDLPPLKSEADWQKLVKEFIANAEKFIDKVENMDDSILESSFADEKYGTYRRNIEGVIEHSYYHLGQISIIKKMIRENAEK